MKYYYTFGTSAQFPYKKGWVEVIAEDRDEVDKKFRTYFPDKNPGLLNCSSIYTEDNFNKTEMKKLGNLGVFCHEVIE